MKIFFDTEFIGLYQQTSLISIGLVTEYGSDFYAELSDYNVQQINPWIQKNVIEKLRYIGYKDNSIVSIDSDYVRVYGDSVFVKEQLQEWLLMFETVEMWSDVLTYDWMLFCKLFGSVFDIPKNVYYIPFDLATVMKIKGINPDISREKYLFGEVYQEMLVDKNNALYEANIIRQCYEKLTQ